MFTGESIEERLMDLLSLMTPEIKLLCDSCKVLKRDVSHYHTRESKPQMLATIVFINKYSTSLLLKDTQIPA